MGVTIPLPELDVNKPAPAPPPDALAEFQRAASLQTEAARQQAIQAQTEAQQTSNQAQALALKDEMTRRQLAPQFVQKDANGKPIGFDTEGLYNAMLEQGADPANIATMRMKQIEMQKAVLGLGDAQLAHADKVNDEIANSLNSVRDIQDKSAPKATSTPLAPSPVSGAENPLGPPVPGTNGMPAAMLPNVPAAQALLKNQPAGTPAPQTGSAPPGTPESLGAPQPGATPTSTEAALQDSAANAPRPITAEAQMAYQKELIRLNSLGIPIGNFKPVLTDERDLDQAAAELGLHKQVMSEAAALAATQEKTSAAAKSQAEAQAAVWKEAGPGTLVNLQTGALIHGVAPVEQQEMVDWLNKNPGKGPSDFMTHKSQIPVTTRYELENGAGVPGVPGSGAAASPADTAKKFGMTQEAFDQAAEKYYTTGQLPPVGRGISGIALNRDIMNRAGDLHPGASLAANSAEFKANQSSLSKLQTNFDQVSAFEKTAGKNLDLFLDKLGNIPDLNSKFANIPLRTIDDKMIGSDNYQAMKAAQQTASAEAAKVLSSANASGVLSDTQKKEAEDILSGNLSYSAAKQVVATLKQDFANRHQSYQDQISDIQKRMGGKTTDATSSASQAKTSASKASKYGVEIQ
jgi:hypothetical protein